MTDHDCGQPGHNAGPRAGTFEDSLGETPVGPMGDLLGATRLAALPDMGNSQGRADGPVAAVAQWTSDRVAQQVAASVWETLPYTRGELRALVESVDRLLARFAAVREHAERPLSDCDRPVVAGRAS